MNHQIFEEDHGHNIIEKGIAISQSFLFVYKHDHEEQENNDMRNMMKVYLGNDYCDNHLKNFCLYWMKGRETKPDYVKYEDS